MISGPFCPSTTAIWFVPPSVAAPSVNPSWLKSASATAVAAPAVDTVVLSGPKNDGAAHGPKVTIARSDAELFAVFGSDTDDDTLAVFVSGCAACGVTTSVIVAAPPFGSVPSEHVTIPDASVQLPCVAVAVPK